MSNLRDMLTAKALTVIPGRDYNAFRGQQQAESYAQAPPLHFEDALPADGPEKAVVDKVVPSLVRFLRRKKQSPTSPSNVLAALFLGETCFVLSAEAVLEVYCDLESTNRTTLNARIVGWLADEI